MEMWRQLSPYYQDQISDGLQDMAVLMLIILAVRRLFRRRPTVSEAEVANWLANQVGTALAFRERVFGGPPATDNTEIDPLLAYQVFTAAIVRFRIPAPAPAYKAGDRIRVAALRAHLVAHLPHARSC